MPKVVIFLLRIYQFFNQAGKFLFFTLNNGKQQAPLRGIHTRLPAGLQIHSCFLQQCEFDPGVDYLLLLFIVATCSALLCCRKYLDVKVIHYGFSPGNETLCIEGIDILIEIFLVLGRASSRGVFPSFLCCVAPPNDVLNKEGALPLDDFSHPDSTPHELKGRRKGLLPLLGASHPWPSFTAVYRQGRPKVDGQLLL